MKLSCITSGIYSLPLYTMKSKHPLTYAIAGANLLLPICMAAIHTTNTACAAETYEATPGLTEEFLRIAAACGEADTLRQCLATPGVDVNHTQEDGITALLYAVARNDTEITKLLLAAPGIDVNKAETTYGITPLLVAAGNGYAEIVKLLLGVPSIDVNRADHAGRTPLIKAIEAQNAEIIKLLLAAPGIDVNQPNGMPIILAIRTDNAEILELICNAPGIDMNISIPVEFIEEWDKAATPPSPEKKDNSDLP